MKLGWPPLPREHGAWAMLITPLVVMLAVTRPQPLGVMAAAGWILAYANRGPLEVLLGHGASGRAGMAQAEPAVARTWLLLFALAAAALLMPAVWVHPTSLLLLLGAGLLFVGVFWMADRGRARSILSGFLAVAGLMAGAPLIDLAASGAVSARTWCITYACFAFFGGSIFRVKAVARERRRVGFRWLSPGVHLALFALAAVASLLGWAPPLFGLPLLPPFLWAAWGAWRAGAGPSNLGAVGRAEIVLTVLFGLLLIGVMR